MPCTRIAVLFPGQGSQYVGMGRELVERSEAVRELFEEADRILGFPLNRICLEGPEEELTRTENAQPAILLHSYAVWISLPEHIRSRVVVAAGHSLGEFTAHVAAGTLALADALRLVRRRGELMARSGEQRPGTMAAILGLEDGAVREVCEEVTSGTVVPANFNAPGQVVVSGDVAAVEEAMRLAAAAGARRTVRLNVSGAFHSPLMEVARDGLAQALGNLDMRDPAFPVVANVSATPVQDAETARDLLVEQLTSPVRWVECVGTMRGFLPECWLEPGPGRVLSGLLRRIDREQTAFAAADPDGIETFLEASDA